MTEYGDEMGHPNIVGTDMNKVDQQSMYYSQFKDLSIVSMYQKELEPYSVLSEEEIDKQSLAFIEECYNDAYEILAANKSTLDKIVEGTLREGVTSGDKIYNMADVTRPKYNFELSPTEKTIDSFTKWLSWTSKRMSFYDRNNPQF